ncbi:hypothetical protein D039_4718A, partial [Vibrio parahaemolyticus EKP-028]
MWQEHTVRHD